MSPETRERLFRYLREGRVSVLSTCAPTESRIRASCITRARPDCLFFSSAPTTEPPRRAIVARNPRASVAIGWSEVDWVTVQMRGVLRALTLPEEKEAAKAAHYAVHPTPSVRQRSPHPLPPVRAGLGPFF